LAKEVPEYQLKAIFLFNFLDFTEWPNNKRNDRTICILGNNPFNDYLQELASLAKNNQKTRIKHVAIISNANDCHILFISRSETNHLNQILETLDNKPLLTVSDIRSFALKSGMIELSRKSKKTKLIINLNSVNKAGIKLNSNLIDLAQVVDGKQKAGSGK